jgi:hypothetical protein
MQIEAMLCDSATVREGLLHVLGGGINRLWREEFPSQMAATLAMVLDIHPSETELPHSLMVSLRDEDGMRLGEVGTDFNLGRNLGASRPGENIVLPLVISLQTMEIPRPGAYSVDIVVDNQHRRSLTVYACSQAADDRRRRSRSAGYNN